MALRERSGKISIQSLSRGQYVQERSVSKSNHEIWAFPEAWVEGVKGIWVDVSLMLNLLVTGALETTTLGLQLVQDTETTQCI